MIVNMTNLSIYVYTKRYSPLLQTSPYRPVSCVTNIAKNLLLLSVPGSDYRPATEQRSVPVLLTPPPPLLPRRQSDDPPPRRHNESTPPSFLGGGGRGGRNLWKIPESAASDTRRNRITVNLYGLRFRWSIQFWRRRRSRNWLEKAKSTRAFPGRENERLSARRVHPPGDASRTSAAARRCHSAGGKNRRRVWSWKWTAI